MKLHRFFGDFNFEKKFLEIKDNFLANQLKNVLRLKSGNQIILADGKLNEALAEIVSFDKSGVRVKILGIDKNENESKINATLYCSILKRENFELVVQKATEAGIKEITPIICKRTVKLNIRQERMKKIIKEAAEQSGRGFLSHLNESLNFQKAVDCAEKNNFNLFFDLSGESLGEKPLSELKFANSGSSVGIFIGPEGGWSDEEIKRAKENNFKIISLGKLALRAETAAIISSYIVSNIG